MDPTIGLVSEDSGQFEAIAEMSKPLRVRLGMAWRFDKGHLAVEGDVSTPVETPELAIDRVTSWNVRAGGTYDIEPDLHLGFGFFTDRGPERDNAIHFYGLTLGLAFDTVLALGDDEAADEIKFGSFFALRYALGLGTIDGLVFDPTLPELFRTQPTDLIAHEVFLHLGSSIDL